MAQRQEQALTTAQAASILLDLSRDCSSLEGESSVNSDWMRAYKVQSPPRTQTLTPEFQGVPDDSTSQKSWTQAVLATVTPDESSLVASTEGRIERPPDQCGEGFDRGLQYPSHTGSGDKDIGKKKATVVLADESDQAPSFILGPPSQSSNVSFSYTTEFTQGAEPVENRQEIPGKCSDSLARCRHSGKKMEPQYFAAAEYLYELVYKKEGKMNWDFFGRNLTRYRSCDFILMNGNKNKGLRPITSFMTWVRFEIMEIHQGCSTLEWALQDAGYPRIKGSTAVLDLKTAYEKMKDYVRNVPNPPIS
jgi:hypothetical protein